MRLIRINNQKKNTSVN